MKTFWVRGSRVRNLKVISVKIIFVAGLLLGLTNGANAAMVSLDIQKDQHIPGFSYSWIHASTGCGGMCGDLWYSLDGLLIGEMVNGNVTGISGDIELTGVYSKSGSNHVMSITDGYLNTDGTGQLLFDHGYISFSSSVAINGLDINGFTYWGEIWKNGEKYAGIDLGGDISPVPLPPAAFLFLSALIGLFTVSKRKSLVAAA